MAHKFFKDLEGHARIEQLRRKSVAKTVRRIMSAQTGGSEILIHQHIDVVRGGGVLGPRPTGKEIPAGPVVIPPDLYGLCHIWREVHDPIHLPFATGDAHRASAECHLTHKSATSAKICVKKTNLAKICVKLSLKKRQKGGGIHGKMPTIAC